jgi:hypothetical protein
VAILEFASDEEFVVLVVRRVDARHVALLGKSEHDAAMVEKALRRLRR